MLRKNALQAGHSPKAPGLRQSVAGARPQAGLCMEGLLYSDKALKYTACPPPPMAPGGNRARYAH